MDFSNAGTTEPAGAGFRAHVTWYDKGSNRNIYGPNRKDKEAAKEDLESMRAAASGMGREDGFAAMAGEAKRLIAGKAPKKVGSIERAGNVFRVHVHFKEEGTDVDIHGPWRPLQAATRCRRP